MCVCFFSREAINQVAEAAGLKTVSKKKRVGNQFLYFLNLFYTNIKYVSTAYFLI